MKFKIFRTVLVFLIFGITFWFGRDYLPNLKTSLFGSPENKITSPTGLIAYYKMNSEGGLVKDYSGNGNDMTIYGSTPTPGKIGSALSFDGEDDRVGSMSMDFSGNEYTMTAWVYNTDPEANQDAILTGALAGEGIFLWALEGNTRLRVNLYDGNYSSCEDISLYSFTKNQWHFVAFQRDGSATKLCIDETCTSGSVSGDCTMGTISLFIGRYGGARYWNGIIDEVRIYNSVLTEDEMNELYKEGNRQVVLNAQETSGNGLAGWWPLGNDYETLGTDLLSGWNFNTGWNPVNGASVTDSVSFTSDADGGGIRKSLLTAGKRYRVKVTGYTSSTSSFAVTSGNGVGVYYGPSATSPFDISSEFTAVDGYLRLYSYGNNITITITSLSLYEIQTSDITSNKNHGSFYPGSGGYTTDHHGQANRAYDFDGSVTYLDLGDVLEFDKDDPVSFSFWINLDGIQSRGILSKSDPATSYKGWQIHFDGNALVYRNYYNGSNTGIRVKADDTLPVDTWKHVVVTYDGSENASGVNIYYDGSIVTDTDEVNAGFGGSTLNDTSVNIGRHSYGDGFLDGSLSDMKVCNRVLSATEIDELYHSYNSGLRSPLSKGLVGHWELTSKWSNGTDIQDLTPNNNNGTASNVTVGGRASLFDGADSTIPTTITSNDDFQNGFTISAWIKQNSLGEGDSNNRGYLISKEESLSGLNGFHIGIKYSHLYFSMFEQPQYLDPYTTFPLNSWSHVVATFTDEGANVRSTGYIDGEYAYTNTVVGNLSGIDTNYPLTIGNRSNATDRTFDGQISDVRIYDHPLSTTEITQLYNMGRPRGVDRSAELDGTTPQYFTLDDGADAGDDLEPTTNDYLLEAWVNADAFSANQILVAKSSDITGSTNLYGMYLNTSGKLVGKIADSDSVTTSTDDGTALTADRWYHTAIAFDRSGNMTRYIDGTATGTADDISSEADSITNAVAFSVGAESDGGLPLDGQIDSVRVYEFTSGLPANIASIMTYNAQSKGRIHPDITSSLVEGYDFNSDPWASITSTHNLTNNGSATYVKP